APQCELKAEMRTLNRLDHRVDTPINCKADAGRLAAGVVVTSGKSDIKISHCACLACYLSDDLLTPDRFRHKVLVACFESVCKAEDLKTVAITDDPKLQLTPVPVGGGHLVKVQPTPLLFDGSHGHRAPTTRDPARKAVRGAGPFEYAISGGWRGSRMS